VAYKSEILKSGVLKSGILNSGILKSCTHNGHVEKFHSIIDLHLNTGLSKKWLNEKVACSYCDLLMSHIA